jgi:hypothetical protein
VGERLDRIPNAVDSAHMVHIQVLDDRVLVLVVVVIALAIGI